MQTIQGIMGFSRVWEIGAKVVSKRGISCFETENYCLFWECQRVKYTSAKPNNCVSKAEVRRKIISVFQIFRKDRQTDRQTSYQEFWVWEPHLSLFVTHCEIHFFQSSMHHTAVYQQQETGHEEKQISSRVGVVSLSWGGNFPAIGLIHSAPHITEIQSAMFSVKCIF